ncbi:MAG: YceI family protein [Pseudomonadota bacterium]
MRTARMLVAAMIAAAQPLVACAEEWRLDREASVVSFSYIFFGAEESGTFARFGGTADYSGDAGAPVAATLWAETASIDLGNRLRDAAARSSAGFASSEFPLARFELTRLTPLGAGRFRARGIASIKGREKEIEADIRVDLSHDQATAQGALVVDRRDFGIGTGPLMALIDLGDQVAIEFSLIAHPVGITTPQAQQEELQ